MKNEIRVAANAAVENLIAASVAGLIPVRVAKKDCYAIDNIMMLRAISPKMEYQRVIGLNKTTIFLS